MRTKTFLLLSMIFFTFLSMSCTEENNIEMQHDQKVLRHVVLFKFKEGTSSEKIKEIENAFAALPEKIEEVLDFEWGMNNSPEMINKGFTHCFLVTFKDEKAREIYLPHPDHKVFTEIVGPHVADVLVVDYWNK